METISLSELINNFIEQTETDESTLRKLFSVNFKCEENVIKLKYIVSKDKSKALDLLMKYFESNFNSLDLFELCEGTNPKLTIRDKLLKVSIIKTEINFSYSILLL